MVWKVVRETAARYCRLQRSGRCNLSRAQMGGRLVTTTPQGYYDCSLERTVWCVEDGDNIYPFDQFAKKYHRPTW